MIGGCITSGKYNMTATLYKKSGILNPKTGQVKANYLYNGEFSLMARGLTNLRGKDSGTMQDWGNKLNEYHFIHVKTMQHMDDGDIIHNIIDGDGMVYLDDEIQFVVLGITPTYDPFGRFLEYDVICNKAEVPVRLVQNIVSAQDSLGVVGG